MRLLLQFPEGLKRNAMQETEDLEKSGHEVFISSSPCFGSCDLALDEAKAIKAEKIIHWGHSDFGIKTSIPVEYREYPIEIDIGSLVKRTMPKLKAFKRIGLVTTVQHVKQLPDIAAEFKKNGKMVFIGKGKKAKYRGQVLGCDAEAATNIEHKVDCLLYIGGGLFHPLIETETPVIRADPFSGEVAPMNSEIKKASKRRKNAMNSLIVSKRVGILLSTKPGQRSISAALRIKKLLQKNRKKCVVLVSNTFDFNTILNFGKFDCFVNTACPRISDDIEQSGKPIINYGDAITVAKILGEEP